MSTKLVAIHPTGLEPVTLGLEDRFKTLPGDDHSADVHVGGTNPANGARNGLIEGAWNTTESADESSSGATLINCR